jgi:hypothetical protein
VYSPVVEAIRDSGVMERFPDRTEADLYLWIVHRREELRECYGPQVDTGDAAADFAAQHAGQTPDRTVDRLKRAAKAVWSALTG